MQGSEQCVNWLSYITGASRGEGGNTTSSVNYFMTLNKTIKVRCLLAPLSIILLPFFFMLICLHLHFDCEVKTFGSFRFFLLYCVLKHERQCSLVGCALNGHVSSCFGVSIWNIIGRNVENELWVRCFE